MGEKSSSFVAHLEAHNSNTDLQEEPKPVESGNTFKSIQEELDSLCRKKVDGGRLELILENIDSIIKIYAFPYRCNKDWLT